MKKRYTVDDGVFFGSIANLFVLYRISTVRCLDFDFHLLCMFAMVADCFYFIFSSKYSAQRSSVALKYQLIPTDTAMWDLSSYSLLYILYVFSLMQRPPTPQPNMWCPTSDCNSQSNPDSCTEQKTWEKSHISSELLSHTAFWCSDKTLPVTR